MGEGKSFFKLFNFNINNIRYIDLNYIRNLQKHKTYYGVRGFGNNFGINVDIIRIATLFLAE